MRINIVICLIDRDITRFIVIELVHMLSVREETLNDIQRMRGFDAHVNVRTG